MKIYEFMATRNVPRSYTGKILLVSFLGVHVPMIGAVAYVLLADSTPFMEQIDILLAMLVATLVGTAATMGVMIALLSPMRAATDAASGYLREQRLPQLPTRFTDDAGILLSSVQECITRLDSAIASSERRLKLMEQDRDAKFRMIAGMRHDFRAPLTHILGFADLMRSEAIGPIGTEAYKKYVTTIGTSGHELLQTLNSVLDLSDAETRRQMDDDSEEVDLAELLRATVAREHLHAEKRDIFVTLDVPRRATAVTVRAGIETIASTLLQAAISAAPHGGRVDLALDGTEAITLSTLTGRLSLEDVPPGLTHLVDGPLDSGTGSADPVSRSSTPMTLRLSLIHSLCTAIGAGMAIRQNAGDGYTIRIILDHVEPMPVAAE